MPRPGRCTLRRETWYPLYRRLGGPHGRSGRMRKISLLPGSIPEPSSPHTVPCGRIFVDVEMQKSNHNRSTGDQINAVCLVNNTNYCSCSHWKHTQVTSDLAMSSGMTKFMNIQYVSEMSD